MDKSNPRWVMVPDKQIMPRYKRLEPLTKCSNMVTHNQLVHALKTTQGFKEPDPTQFQQDIRKVPLAVPLRAHSSHMRPPYPYPGAPIRGMGTNNHHESRDTSDRIQTALEARKRAMYTRQHESWSLPIYGNFAERENLMQGYRNYLKSQMEEKSWKKRQEFTRAVTSTRRSYEETKTAIEQDNQAEIVKKQNQRCFRDDNKKMMEERQEQIRSLQRQEIEQERRLIKLDPINWSRTLR